MNNQEHNSKKELLFHYTKFDTALFHILPDQRLLMNPISLMNDIYEMKNSLDNVLSGDFFERLKSNNTFDYLKSNKLKLLSFSKDGHKRRGFDNSLMWSFYGEHYNGVCLIFDKKRLDEKFASKFALGELGFHFDIKYEYKTPAMFKSHDNPKKPILRQNEPNDTESYVSFFEIESQKIWELLRSEERYKDLFFRKGKEWDNENEYRYLIYKSEYEVPYPNYKPLETFLEVDGCLEAVVIGPDFKNENKFSLMKKVVNDKKLNLFSSRFENNKIQIIEDPNSNIIRYSNYNSIFR